MAKFVQIVGKEEPYEVLQCLRCQRIYWMLHQGKTKSRICPYCTRRAITVISADAKQNVVNCVVCEKIIEDTVFVCDHCGFTVCFDCIRMDDMLYCLECWVK